MVDLRFVTEHWPLSGVSFGESFVSYPTRRVVQVHANEGTFVAKINSEPLTMEESLKSYAIFDFLQARDFTHAPALLKTLAGESVLYTEGQSVAIMEYIDGGHPEATIATWQELGRIAARLNALTDYPFAYAIPTKGVIVELTEEAQSHVHKAQFLEFIALLSPLLDDPRQGLVHGEINLTNAMRRRNGELVLIDWDEAGTGTTVLEAGYPLVVVFLTEELHFQQELARAFYNGYYGDRLPSAAEKDLLFRTALLHALRYMRFANQEKRWRRVCYAVEHKERLLTSIWGVK